MVDFGQLGPNRLPGSGEDLTWGCDTFPLRIINKEKPRLCVEGKKFVFDCDGLIFNSEPFILRAIFEATTSLAQQTKGDTFCFLTEQIEDIKVKCFGVGDREMSVKLFSWMKESDLLSSEILEMDEDTFIDHFKNLRQDLYVGFARDGFIKPMPGSVEFILDAYDKTGMHALNTGTPESIQSQVLDYVLSPFMNVEEVFPHHLRVYADTPGNKGKPDPAGYLIASEKLGVTPENLIAVEDRANGALSAFRAGYGRVITAPENLYVGSFYNGENKVRENLNRIIVVEKLTDIDLVL